MNFPLFPDRASSMAWQVDAIFFVLLVLSSLIVLGVAIAIVYFGIKYRRGSQADRTHRIRHPLGLEIAWTVVPFGIFLFLFGWGASVYFDIRRPPADALEIAVVAKQWMWKFEHPGGQREINALHVPVGRSIKLTMISQDVIHDLFVPAFRLKQDVLPGRYLTLWFTATQEGSFRFFCSQFCGTEHASMGGWVVVMAPDAYARWLAVWEAQDTTALAGAKLFARLGCAGCHGANAAVRAPALAGLYGKPVPLVGGGFTRADERYLRDSILLPASQVVAGYAPIMPSYQGQIGEAEVLQLVAYLKTLKNEERTRP
ncbi:MAG TPA: cytochrome c oxidase subunit II [Pantanalinema sp.]